MFLLIFLETKLFLFHQSSSAKITTSFSCKIDKKCAHKKVIHVQKILSLRYLNIDLWE